MLREPAQMKIWKTKEIAIMFNLSVQYSERSSILGLANSSNAGSQGPVLCLMSDHRHRIWDSRLRNYIQMAMTDRIGESPQRTRSIRIAKHCLTSNPTIFSCPIWSGRLLNYRFASRWEAVALTARSVFIPMVFERSQTKLCGAT